MNNFINKKYFLKYLKYKAKYEQLKGGSGSSTAAPHHHTKEGGSSASHGNSSGSTAQPSDAWDAFGGLLMQHGKQTYGW